LGFQPNHPDTVQMFMSTTVPLSTLSPPVVRVSPPPESASQLNGLDCVKVERYLSNQKRRHKSWTSGAHFGARLDRSIYNVIQSSVYQMQMDGELPPSSSVMRRSSSSSSSSSSINQRSATNSLVDDASTHQSDSLSLPSMGWAG